MINNSPIPEYSVIQNFYKEAFKIYGVKKNIPTIKLRFYPYININHTIRIRNGVVLIKISDTFQNAPANIHHALSHILVAKLLNKKVPTKARKIYREFVNSEEIRNLALQNKIKKGKKITTSAIGDFFNLDGMFEKINLVYFENRVSKPTLSWSKQKTYRRLGHYDSAHNTIVISKSLDTKFVPKFVVEYVLYHEMLHIKHPAKYKNGRRNIHTTEFKRDEQKFAYFEEAEDWIELNAAKLKRNARK